MTAAYVVWRQYVASDGTPLAREYADTEWTAKAAEALRARVDDRARGVVGVVEMESVLDAPCPIAVAA